MKVVVDTAVWSWAQGSSGWGSILYAHSVVQADVQSLSLLLPVLGPLQWDQPNRSGRVAT